MTWLTRMVKNQKGVTLIELLVVVVILGIIAAVAIPAVMANQEDAYVSTNQQNLKIVQEAVTRYQIDNPSAAAAASLHDGTGTGNIDGVLILDTASTDSLLTPNYLQEIPAIYNANGNTSFNWQVTVRGNNVVTITLP